MNCYLLKDLYQIHYKKRYQKWANKYKFVNEEYLKKYKIMLFDLDYYGKVEYLINKSEELSYRDLFTKLVNWRDLDYIYESQIKNAPTSFLRIYPWLSNYEIIKNLSKCKLSIKKRYLLPNKYCYSIGLDERNRKQLK